MKIFNLFPIFPRDLTCNSVSVSSRRKLITEQAAARARLAKAEMRMNDANTKYKVASTSQQMGELVLCYFKDKRISNKMNAHRLMRVHYFYRD